MPLPATQKTLLQLNALRALDVLYEAEERFTRVVGLLSAPSHVKSLLMENQRRPGGDRFKRLWQASAQEAAKFHIERRNTDWFFENFWPNPFEPKHSKLLAYFLSPAEGHLCGEFLLRTFFETLNNALEQADPNAPRLPTDCCRRCSVDSEKARIDVSIKCGCVEPKLAVIIENKVNDAKNQDRQLERYVESLCNQGYRRIFVFYLPRTSEGNPDTDDLKAVNALRKKFNANIFYAKFTFETQILEWLETARKNWPKDLNQDLCDHLNYYRRLIAYLVNKNKQNKMDSEILKSIQKEEKAGFLTLSDIDAACNSAASLKRVFERVLRGRLLRRIHEDLRKGDLRPNFYATESPRLIYPTSDYADEFENEIVVGVEVNDAIAVGCGWDKQGFFFAYVRLHNGQGQFDDVVQGKARQELGDINTQDSGFPYYAFKYETVAYQDCQEEKTAADKAMRIREMRERLQQALP